jgi:hypothetical protein
MLLATLLFAVVFVSCEDGDADADYGFALLYMPQATSSGGLDNNYYVPSGEGEYTYNFKIKDGKVDIFLGVLRAGQLPNSPYQVDIISRADTTTQIVQSGIIENSVVMAESHYTLPSMVSVPGDKNGKTFYMTVPVEVLKRAEYTGKKLVMTVAITNPSKYGLNTRKTNTVVIIDRNALLDIIE